MPVKDLSTLESTLTERQKKWITSVQAGLESKTGKTLEQWVEIAATCPETAPRARLAWFKQTHGLLQNHAIFVLSKAFPSASPGWDQPQASRAALWTDASALVILEAIEHAVAELPEHVSGQRKQFTSFSRKVQFASAKPVKGGKVDLGLAIAPSASPRLAPARKDAWSERLKAVVRLNAPTEVDGEIRSLLRLAWERS